MSVVAINAVRASTDDYVERTDYLATGSVIDEIAWVTSGGISYLDVTGRPKTRGILTVVGVVSPSRLHVTPGGNWNPKYNELKKAKFQFTLVAPDPTSPFHPHFALALERLRTLQGRVAHTTGNRKYLLVEEDGVPGIRLNQDMFEPRRVPMVEDGTDATIRWPLDGAARDALLQVAPYHCIRPMMAYDFEDRLVDPRFMESTLVGALVEVNFWLRHMSLTDKTGKVDVYTGFVEQIRVLRKAVQPEPSPFRANPSAGPVIFGRARAPVSSPVTPVTPPTTPSAGIATGSLQTIPNNSISPSTVTPNPSLPTNPASSLVTAITVPDQPPLTTGQAQVPPPINAPNQPPSTPDTQVAGPVSVDQVTPSSTPATQPVTPPAPHVSDSTNRLPQPHTAAGPPSSATVVNYHVGATLPSVHDKISERQGSSTITVEHVVANPGLSMEAGGIGNVVSQAVVQTNGMVGTQDAPVTPSHPVHPEIQTPIVLPSPITPTMTTPRAGDDLSTPSYNLSPSPMPHTVGKSNSVMLESLEKSGTGAKGRGKRVADDSPGGEPSRKTRNMTARGQ